MFAFIVCLVVIAGSLGFLAGVLISGSSAYDRGWRAHARHQANIDAEARRAGFRVLN